MRLAASEHQVLSQGESQCNIEISTGCYDARCVWPVAVVEDIFEAGLDQKHIGGLE